MRGGKYYFSAVTREGSSKSELKSPNSQSTKTDSVGCKKTRRPKNFKTDDWYEKAVLLLTISANINNENAVNDYQLSLG